MIPSDGGGGTAWSAYSIEELHAMVQAVDDGQISTSHEQVTAWRKTHELLDDHMGTLKYYKQGLVDNWPPEKSPASAAFVKYVDDLITSLETASQAAKANESALYSLTTGVVKARDEVKAAYREYAANKAKLDAAAKTSTPSVTPTPTPTPTPSPGPPPVAPGRQEELTQRAQAAMATLSTTANQSHAQMKVPPPYTPPQGGFIQNREHIDTPAAVMMTPPVIPAPRTSASQGGLAAAPAPNAPFPTTVTSGGAPVLTGGAFSPPPTITPTPPIAPPITPPPGGGPLPGVIGVPGGFGGGKNPPKGPGLPKVGPLSGGGGPVPGLPVEGHGPTAAPARPLAPGGVIGGAPGMGGGAPGMGGAHAATGGGRPGGPRPNPVGGVLGQGGGAGGPASPHGVGANAAGQPPLAGQRRTGGDRDDESQQWDPDDPWAVERGVAPVLQPSTEQSSHEPGPGVIGIDR
ncbi:hypothetical protein [Planosporangium mesophilum]|uniref:PPE family domain-containing protein n=1 Tax=Planosporangium mesophilum TaxID=689768 RepID=A0A8J3TA41_9ACTN|nr:hypothetical protein [Planosporangium mesophilum]NJC83401.1 hypothetical protein [Planosporangium mesophilum]GII21781.1 hypothetical protein Pme01_13780 [Planosporangium mesophilum]